MIKYISSPNLPQGKISKVICGTDDRRILDFFSDESIEVISFEPNRCVDPAISAHADIIALHLSSNDIIIDKSQDALAQVLSDLDMNVHWTEKSISGAYPFDVALNFAVFGDFAVGNFKYADKNLMPLISEKRLINVNQGYCKCSMLIINESAVVTDDESIYRELMNNDFDCLLISKGDISLVGHEYGFLGGASFKLSHDTVVFFGNVKKHRDFESIKAFLDKHGCSFVCTDDGDFRDIGGIVSICEKNPVIC